MEFVERSLIWVLGVVLVVGVAAVAYVWLPMLQKPESPTAIPVTSSILGTSATALPLQQTSTVRASSAPSVAPAIATAIATTAIAPTGTSTPSPRLPSTPTARPDIWATPANPLATSLLPSSANRSIVSVSSLTGALSYSFTDVVTSFGAGVAFTRSYSSDVSSGSELGPGWTHSYAVRLEKATDESADLILVGPAGGRYRFARQPDGTFASPAGQWSGLRKTADGFAVTRDDGTTWNFRSLSLTSIVGVGGGTTKLTYRSGTQSLLRIAGADGRDYLSLAYDSKSGRLLSVSDSLDPPRIVAFGYDSRGRLATVTDREGRVTRYSYQGSSIRLSTIVDALGRTVASIGYDGRARVVSLADARGKITGQSTRYAYRAVAGGSTETTITYPPSGSEPGFRPSVVETFDLAGRLVRRVTRASSGDPPLTEELAYATDGSLTWTIRKGGMTTLPQATRATSGSSGMMLMEVPRPALLVSVTSALERARAGNLPHQEDAFGCVTSFDTPNDAENPGPRKGTWAIRCDKEGRVRFIQGPTGAASSATPVSSAALGTRVAVPAVAPDLELRYDEVGNLIAVIGSDGKTTTYTYDERNLIVEARLSTGENHEYAYDDRGDPIRATAIRSAGGQQVAEYAFDGLRRLRRVTDYPFWPDQSRTVVAETVYGDGGGNASVVIYQR